MDFSNLGLSIYTEYTHQNRNLSLNLFHKSKKEMKLPLQADQWVLHIYIFYLFLLFCPRALFSPLFKKTVQISIFCCHAVKSEKQHLKHVILPWFSTWNLFHVAGRSNITIWSLSGNQGEVWNQGQAPLPQGVPFTVVFEGRRGTSYTGDIAIDDISFTPSNCGGRPLYL